MIYLCFNNKH